MADEEWKNAIEGRMGRLKFSLITEPKFAHDAAAVFREMKQFEDCLLYTSWGKTFCKGNGKFILHPDWYYCRICVMFYYVNDPSDNRSEC